MEKLQINGHKIVFYNNIEELPIKRYHKFNKLLLIEANIGSTVADVDRHLHKAMLLVGAKRNEDAMTELQNLRQNIIFVQNSVSPTSLAFAALIKEMDGEPCNDLTDEALKKIADRLQDVAAVDIHKTVAAQKKKIDEELAVYFGSMLDDNADKAFFDIIRRRALLQMQSVCEEKDNPEIYKLTKELMLHHKPKCFTGNNNFETLCDKQFEKMILTLSQRLNGANVKDFTVLEFYNAVELIKQQDKEINKKLRNK